MIANPAVHELWSAMSISTVRAASLPELLNPRPSMSWETVRFVFTNTGKVAHDVI